MAEVVIKRAPDAAGGWKQIAADISGEMGPLLDLIGNRLTNFFVQNIRTSSFAGNSWKQQYPNLKSSEFIHKAGALADLNKGGYPKARRFQRKKPLIDTGNAGGLIGSFAYRHVGKDAVEAGTTKEYAATQQFGLESEMPVTQTAKDKYKMWVKRTKAGKQHGKKLRSVMAQDTLQTQVVARPFVGVSDRIAGQIRIDVEKFVRKALREKSDG